MPWIWAVASCRGVSHERSNSRKQDAQVVFVIEKPAKDILVCVVSDGAGSAPFGGEGASLICKSISTSARNHFNTASEMPTDDTFRDWIDAARDRLFFAAQKRSVPPNHFAATLLLVLSCGSESAVAHIGDGCAVHRDMASETWEALIWPDHGEYASTTSFVTDEPPLAVRIARSYALINSHVIFTDGIERLALNFKDQQPFPPFFEAISHPVFQSLVNKGRDKHLSTSLKTFLNSSQVNERTDDDKTLIVAIKK